MLLSSSSRKGRCCHHHHHHHHEKTSSDDNESRLLGEREQPSRQQANNKNNNKSHKDDMNSAHHHHHHVLSRQVMLALLVCSLCCFLCCASTFDVLRELTSWSPPSNVDVLVPAASSSSSRLVATASTASTTRTPTSTSRSHPHSKEEDKNATWTIFYNIYIRPNSTNDDWQATMAILEDQLAQVGNSYATSISSSSSSSNNNAPLVDLYYNTIGSPRLVPPPSNDSTSSSSSLPSSQSQSSSSSSLSYSASSSSWLDFDGLCRRNHLHCHHMQHYDQGFESKTLLEAHRFCQRRNPADHDHVVIYLHNKGSFHSSNSSNEDTHDESDNNNNTMDAGSDNSSSSNNSNNTAYSGQAQWRRAMTAAATSQQCLESLMTLLVDNDEKNHDACDACGLLFQPLPYEHYPGNIWSARCSYIQRLINPFALRQERASLMERLFNSSRQRELLQFQQEQQEQQNRSRLNEKLTKVLSQSTALQSAAAAAATATTATPPILQANLFPLANAMTGGDRYLSEFWLGSHPWFRPCDLSKNISLQYWKEHDVPTRKTGSSSLSTLVDAWELHAGPRGSILDSGWEYFKYMYLNATDLLWQYSTATTNKGDDNDNIRRRRRRRRQQRHHQEFFLLPGRLLKWMFIYNTTPPKDSWVWSWFPHGHEWKMIAAIADHDEDNSIMHQATSLLLSTASTISNFTMVNNSKHHNETLQRFQEYYEEIMDVAANVK